MRTRLLRYVELVLWVATVSGAVLVLLALPSFLFWNGLLTLKYALFVVGFLLFGVGSFAIQPTPRGKDPVSRLFAFSVDGDIEFGFEERIQQLPPLKDAYLPLSDRVSRNVKLFVSSLVLLGVSLFLEVALGVAVS